MKPLVSVIIPTRNRIGRLHHAMTSVIGTANDKSRVQFVLKIDDDDLTDYRRYDDPASIKVVRSPRGKAYADMGRFVTEACNAADGQWCFLMDDDAWLYGMTGWDDQLALLPTKGWVAQAEKYHLGGSRYGPGSCGPVGLFFPNGCWRKLGHESIGDVVDEWLRQLLVVQHGWQIHLFRGLTYRHNRDDESALAEHRKL